MNFVDEISASIDDSGVNTQNTINSGNNTSKMMPKLFKLDTQSLKRTEGWVWKKGGINGNGLRRRNWKKRWFVLVEHNTDSYPKYEVEYYTKPDGVLKGRIDLEGKL